MTGRRARRVVIVVVAAAAVAAFAVFGLAARGTARRTAPALPGQLLSGAHVDLAQLRGRPAFVVFWASWCPPCRQEAPAIERFARSLGGRARLVGVDWSDPDTGDARAFEHHYGWTFTSLRDDDGSIGLGYGLTALPTTFLLD